MKKRSLILLIVMALLIGMGIPTIAASIIKTIKVSTGVTIYLNDLKLDTKDATGKPVEAFIYEGTTYLPVRAISDALKIKVEWDGKTQSVYLGEHTKVVTPEPVKDTKSDWVGKYTEEYTYVYGDKNKSTELYEAKYIPYIELNSNGTLKYRINLFYETFVFDGKWEVDTNDLNKINVTGMEGIKHPVSFIKSGNNLVLQVKDYIYYNSDTSTSTNGDTYKKK